MYISKVVSVMIWLDCKGDIHDWGGEGTFMTQVSLSVEH